MPLAVIIAQALITYGPEIATDIASILHATGDPALAQWQAVFAKVRTYQQIIAPKSAV